MPSASKRAIPPRLLTLGWGRWRRVSWVDAVCLAALGIVVWIAAGFLLRDDLYIFGDHPGQYWRMWYALNVAFPLHHRLIDWVPYWYAGYPELQFYPPGYVLFGWVLNVLTAGTLSTVWIYEIVTFVSYALPGFTFYYGLRHLGFGVRAAFVGGLFGLIFPAIWGGAKAPFIGMVGSRLAFGLDPLVLVWTIDLLEKRGRKFVWLGAGALAVGILAHPYHEIGIFIGLGLYILIRRLPLVQSCLRLGMLVAIAFSLDAFWLVPLFAHSTTNVVPIIRATLDQTWRNMTDEAIWPYMLLALSALLVFAREKDPARRAVVGMLFALPPVIAATSIADHVVLVNRLQYYQFDPVRLLGEYNFAIIMLAAVGTSEIASWLARITRSSRTQSVLGWGLTLLPCALLFYSFFPAQAFYFPQENGEPRFLKQATVDYHLDELWNVLRASPGRVLFTSSYSHLNMRDDGELDTTIPALSPLFTGRALMGGTFSHWSPIAALMWGGSTRAPVLWGRVEELDDRALFGIPLEELSGEQLYLECQRYNITTVVASIDDYQTRTWLDASPQFQSYYNNGYFFVYRVKGYENAWLDAGNASVELTSLEDDHISFRVHNARPDAHAVVKEFAYPLWRAFTDTGEELAITRDEGGLMQIELPPGKDYGITLRYQDGVAEWLGTILSIAGSVLFLGFGGVMATKHKRDQVRLPQQTGREFD